MSNLEETSTWESGIYQLEETDPVQGGPSGIDNLQAKQLANRTKYLKQEVETAQAATADHVANANPHPQYASVSSLESHQSAPDPHPQYTTAAELAAALAGSGFATGTRLAFPQATAPVGWTQDTSDASNNRMLRVVTTAGGGVAGTHSPIINNVVPAHTHGFTTGIESADHTHAYRRAINAVDGDRGSSPSLWSIDNEEFASTNGASSSHTHSGSTDNGSSQTNWQPRYIDLIICSKN